MFAMPYYVYQSNQFREDAERLSIPQELIDRQIVRWVESRQSIGCFDRFPMPFLTKKQFAGRNYRVIAAEEVIELDGRLQNIVVLLRLVTKSSKTYDGYQRDPVAVATPWLERERSLLAAWLAAYLPNSAVVPHPEPTPTESAFLFDRIDAAPDDDILVCESNEWIADVKVKTVSNRLVHLCSLVGEIASAASRDSEPFEEVRRMGDLAVRYRCFPQLRKVLLLRVVHQSEPAADGRPLETDHKSVLRRCVRAYASLLLADEDRWMEIERADEGAPNLALSPEEAEVLNSSRGPSGSGGFPMFINGRAGSGKSTVLQYLFSDTIRSWRRNCPAADLQHQCPIYLATNHELLAKARKNVVSLLRLNANAVILNEHIADSSWLEQLGTYAFQTTSTALRSQLPEAKRLRFGDADRINYGRFRELWMARFGKQPKMLRQCGPQISWHVIRSFIKGLMIDGYLESVEDFDETPRAERNVSPDVFKLVFEKVWLDWYQDLTATGPLWDDQDLARAVLDLQDSDDGLASTHEHLAVFCDEAQDLTRPEIECLYRLSAFSRRTLDRESARRVPFVFAGDPFQTLNPTGFRWEAMKSSFNERLTSNLARHAQGSDAVRLNYQQLSHNYRSMRPVVSFCNAIQCVRAVATDADVQPQESWTTATDAPQPMYFSSDDPTFAQSLKQQQDLTIIVPCEEGEEAEYVRSSTFLDSIVEWDSERRIPQAVYSAIRAKGLEFNRILLFGFGREPEAGILNQSLSPSMRSAATPREEILRVEYFLNKLYVGASRAMKRLFIVDNPAAFQEGGLWAPFADEPRLHAVISRLTAAQHGAWRDSTTTIVPGAVEALGQDRDDPQVLAENFYRDGMAQRSSYSLRQAALQWRRAKQSQRAAAADAQAAEWDGDHRRAGELFIQAGDYSRALETYFTGSEYTLIGTVTSSAANLANRIEARLAGLISASTFSLRDFESLLGERARIAETAPLATALPGQIDSYARAIAAALKRAGEAPERAPSQAFDSKRAVVRNACVLIGAGLRAELIREPLAVVAEQCADHETVMRLYADDIDAPIARRAHAELVLEGRRQATSQEDIRSVARILRERGRAVDAAEWFLKCKDTVAAGACIADALGAGAQTTDSGVRSAFLALVDRLMADLSWRELFSLFERFTISGPTSAKSGDAVRTLLDDLCIVEQKFIPFVARQPNSTIDPVANDLVQFLKRFLGDSLPRWRRWRSRVRIEHVGAAYERANNLVAALQFYEILLTDKSASPPELRFARQRWLRCKQRQIGVETARAQSGTSQRTSHVTKLEEDVRRFCAKQQVNRDETGADELDTASLPIIPVVLPESKTDDQTQSTAQTPTSGSVSVHGPLSPDDGERSSFEVRHFPARQRIRVDSPDGASILIHTATQTIESQDFEISKADETTWLVYDISARITMTASYANIEIGGVEWTIRI